MTEQTPPEHSGSMDTDRTGLHGGDPVPLERLQESNPARWGTPGTPGPLADLDGEIGAEARRLVAALNPHPAQVPDVERIVRGFVLRLADGDRTDDWTDTLQTLVALRYTVETAISRASAAPLMVPRGDQQGERVAGRAEPPTSVGFCGFRSLHPAHTYVAVAHDGTVWRCLGMDAAGPRG